MTDKRSSLRGPSDETWTRGCGRAPAPENLLRRALAAGPEAPRSSARCPWGKRIPATVASRLTTSARPRQRARPSWFKEGLRAMNSSASKGSATTPHRRRGNGYDGVEMEVGGSIQVWTIRISRLCRTIVDRVGVLMIINSSDSSQRQIHDFSKSAHFGLIMWNFGNRDTLRVLSERCEDVMLCFYVIILTSTSPALKTRIKVLI